MNPKQLHAKETPAPRAPKPFQIEEHTHNGWTIQAVEYHVQVKPRRAPASFHFVTSLRAVFPGVAEPVAFTVPEPMSAALRTMQLVLDARTPAGIEPRAEPEPEPAPSLLVELAEATRAREAHLRRARRITTLQLVERCNVRWPRTRPIIMLDSLPATCAGPLTGPAVRLAA